MGSLAELIQKLDPDVRIRGDQWERICVWILGNHPHYRSQVKRAWLRSDLPHPLSDEWGSDIGTDVIAEAHDGTLWAIQAKAVAADHDVTKREIDSFLTDSDRKSVSFRFVIATTDGRSRNAQRALDDRTEKPARFIGLSDLEAAELDWPEHPDDLRPRRPERKTPRPHQGKARQEVLQGFESSDRGQMIMACGTGKTLTTLWISEAMEARRTLVLVPSLSLLSQTLTEWAANSDGDFDWLPVCSDRTVQGSRSGSEDEWVASVSDLGFPVTTDPDEIASFLRRRKRMVVFSTYQSSPQIAEAYRLGRVPRFDLVIADEAHRTVGIGNSGFQTVLDDDEIPARKRLFTTATPKVFTGRVKKVAGESDLEVASMDDREVYGPVLHRLTFGQAIEDDLLSDYQVVIVGVDDETVAQFIDEGRVVAAGDTITDARSLAAQVGFAKAMSDYGLTRSITFHSRIRRAREFARDLVKVFDWMPPDATSATPWAEHVSGEMSTKARRALIKRLKLTDADQPGVLSNARCLAEGVDVPALDGVAFIDPKNSQTDIVQAVGRAIRLHPKKDQGTIVLPVFIAADEDPEAEVKSSAFKPVWSVLRALRDHDDHLGEELDGLRRQLGTSKSARPGRPDRIIFDLPRRVDVPGFVEALTTQLLERTTSVWEERFGLLERFVQEHGHARVPQRFEVKGVRLGAWVNTQRLWRRSGRLEPERVARLNGLEGWSWDPFADAWDECFGLLERFVQEHGHARVPFRHEVGGVALGAWVNTQRSWRRSGRLEPERVARLNGLEVWSWGAQADAWEERFGLLERFVQEHGHARVPHRFEVKGVRLGAWVIQQRASYHRGQLRSERVTRLNGLEGWSWDPFADAWDECFRLLERFAKENGHARFPVHRKLDGVRLGMWVNGQRKKYRSGKLDPDRVSRLEALPGWDWNPGAAKR